MLYSCLLHYSLGSSISNLSCLCFGSGMTGTNSRACCHSILSRYGEVCQVVSIWQLLKSDVSCLCWLIFLLTCINFRTHLNSLLKVLSDYPEAKMTTEQQQSCLGESFPELVKRLDDGISAVICLAYLCCSPLT